MWWYGGRPKDAKSAPVPNPGPSLISCFCATGPHGPSALNCARDEGHDWRKEDWKLSEAVTESIREQLPQSKTGLEPDAERAGQWPTGEFARLENDAGQDPGNDETRKKI